MRTVAILNLKGGVGKTVTAVNMAHILTAEHHQRVLLIDCDSQCNATEFFCGAPAATTLDDILLGDAEPYYHENILQTPSGVDVIPASEALMDLDLRMIGKLIPPRVLGEMIDCIREDDAYDVVLFDCPPAFNAAAAQAMVAADEVIVPIKLDAWSVHGLANVLRQIHNMKRINRQLKISGALITMWRNVQIIRDAEAELRSLGATLPVFRTVIRRTDKVDEMTYERIPIAAYSPRSAAGIDYRAFVAEWLEGGAENGKA